MGGVASDKLYSKLIDDAELSDEELLYLSDLKTCRRCLGLYELTKAFEPGIWAMITFTKLSL